MNDLKLTLHNQIDYGSGVSYQLTNSYLWASSLLFLSLSFSSTNGNGNRLFTKGLL